MSGQGPFFVVGCARSGTTLLRLMLDGHPRLAVPPESHFVVRYAPRGGDPVTGFPALRRRVTARVPRRSAPSLMAQLDAILSTHQFAAWNLDAELVRSAVATREPATYAQLVDVIFDAYARRHGKERWGDKTPWYVLYLPLLARLFPSAKFVHVIRDGREVAASLADRPWGPDGAIAGAFQWRQHVSAGRRAGGRLGPDRYHELRLEDLVDDPEPSLARLCEFLGETFEPSMLAYERSAAGKVGWLHRGVQHVTSPPTAGLRDWRAGLSASEQTAVEAVCAPLLRDLGYPTGSRSWPGLARAWWDRLRLARPAAR